MFKSKPNSLSPAPSGPNSKQTELPFSFSSPLKSGVIRSGLNVSIGAPTSHLNPFPTGPHPIPEAAASLSTSPDQAALAHASTPAFAALPGLRVIHLAVNRPSEGSSVIKRITQGEMRKESAGERERKLTGLYGVSLRGSPVFTLL